MSQPSPTQCPFGASLQKYWDKRYDYFSRFDEGIQVDEEGLYSVIPEAVGLAQAKLLQGTTVFDGFTGVGGSAIAFARSGKTVITCDTNAERLQMAKHNARIYGVADRITFIHGDFFNVGATVQADIVNLDPPWGGPSYKESNRFLLENFDPNGNELLQFSIARFKQVMLRVPTIFDLTELAHYTTNYTVQDDVSSGTVISRTLLIETYRNLAFAAQQTVNGKWITYGE